MGVSLTQKQADERVQNVKNLVNRWLQSEPNYLSASLEDLKKNMVKFVEDNANGETAGVSYDVEIPETESRDPAEVVVSFIGEIVAEEAAPSGEAA